MPQLSRRSFVTIATGGGLLAAGSRPAAANITDTSLKEALEKRRSTRLYSDAPIAEEQLAELLWSACGVNRPESGGRTAPSWRGSYGIDILVASAEGVRRFDPVAGLLSPVMPDDIRGKASSQPFVATAPAVLIYVADLDRIAQAPPEERIQVAHVDAGIIAQNVYLYCAATGLGTCLVGGADKPGLATVL